jgi:hypothetical protein
MTHMLFFATKEDLLPVFEMIESTCALAYVRSGQFSERSFQHLSRGADIPKLGMASAESSSGCETYLIMENFTHVEMRSIRQLDGSEKFGVDQLVNPDTVTFTAGGLWAMEVLLHGRVATASDSEMSRKLMKLFSSAIRKKFKKVKAYWVGPRAYAFLESGGRLTMAAQSPHEFDLIIAP